MSKKLTPAMRQYMEIKKRCGDAILFFRMGDFYEMFYDDAKAASRVLGLTLTARDKNREVPMCGVPHHAAKEYIKRLLRAGRKVAVCEQVEDPSASKGIVKRAVERIITPGVAMDEEYLDSRGNNFVAAAFVSGDSAGLAYMDVTTGEFRVTETRGLRALLDEIGRVAPKELVISERDRSIGRPVDNVTLMDAYDFGRATAEKTLTEHFGVASLDGFGCAGLDAGVSAAGALLAYVKANHLGGLSHIGRLTPYFTDDFLVLDHRTRRNLEITENMRDGGREGTLVSLLDRTSTAMGARRLRSWLLFPLVDPGAINGRLDAVEELIAAPETRSAVRSLLRGVYDLERIMGRVAAGTASPRDVGALGATLERVAELKKTLSGAFSCGLLRSLSELDDVPEAAALIAGALVDEPAPALGSGPVIREGYNAELDSLKAVGSGGKDELARLELKERERTGIASLKVRYNKVFGYYIEVTRANLANVPDDYTRKQTLVNAERFITPELKEWESRILGAEERIKALEHELFTALRSSVAGFTPRVQATADRLASLDALVSLADTAETMGYTRPRVHDGYSIAITEGRHPVVEAMLRDDPSADPFVPNDLTLDEDRRLLILTGPNMAGKSTYLRQNALIVLMAQTGSFVPAAEASIGVVDRIFTRVGASDDLARGQSTFMVEMNETANILNNATARSFIILDEIGRGTSTFDGLSIAWAVAEYVLDRSTLGAKTLFATHYHELTDITLTNEGAKNYNMAVREWNDRVIFLRKVVPGGSNRSYGIQVARLAGLPRPVVERARELLRNLESGEFDEEGMPRVAARRVAAPRVAASGADARRVAVCGSGGEAAREGGTESGEVRAVQPTLFGHRDPLREALRAVDPDRTTPIEALNHLARLKKLIEP